MLVFITEYCLMFLSLCMKSGLQTVKQCPQVSYVLLSQCESILELSILHSVSVYGAVAIALLTVELLVLFAQIMANLFFLVFQLVLVELTQFCCLS